LRDNPDGLAGAGQMKWHAAVLLGLIICADLSRPATSATLKSLVGKDGRVIIQISGDIEPGDTEALTAAVKAANDAGKLVANLRLNSEGGNLLEGVTLAAAVKYAKMSTNVGKDATCASACFLVFAAGETKFANYTARIGVHGASDRGEETVRSGAATVSMARVAKDLGVPPAIIGRMVVTPPTDMVWLSPAELQSMGTTMVGKPAQTATAPATTVTPPQQTPVEPMQLSPQAKASKGPPTWTEAVDTAMELSARQNNGKANLRRFCQPETKTCFIAVSFVNNKGKNAFLKIVQDMNGKTLRREACELNEYDDIRSCFDWDTGQRRRDMKNAKGDWYAVSDE
jgi:hypothetical protein